MEQALKDLERSKAALRLVKAKLNRLANEVATLAAELEGARGAGGGTTYEGTKGSYEDVVRPNHSALRQDGHSDEVCDNPDCFVHELR